MLGVDERADVGGVVHRVTDDELLGTADELDEELVGDGVVDEQPGAGNTALPLVEGDGEESGVDGVVEVGVGEDHGRGLAAELKCQALEVALGRLDDLAT